MAKKVGFEDGKKGDFSKQMRFRKKSSNDLRIYMDPRISDDYYKNVSQYSSSKLSDKNFQQLLELIDIEGQIQQLTQIKDVAKNAEKGQKGATLMAGQPYEQKPTQILGTPSANLHEILQTGVQSELSYLMQMLDILKKSLGSNNPAVQKLAQEIAQLQADMPNLSSKDIALLNNILSQALNLEGQLGSTAQVAFLKAAQNFLVNLQGYNNANISTLNKELAKINAEISNYTNIQNDLSSIEQLLKLMQSGTKLTSAQLLQLLNSINDLNQRYANMSPADQALFKKFMSSLGGLSSSGTPSMTLAQLMGDYQIYIWTQQYCNNPNNPDTKTGLLNYLKAQIENYPGASGGELAEAMIQRMNSDITNFPGTGVSGEPNWINVGANGELYMNGSFSTDMASIFVGPFAQGADIISMLQQYISDFTPLINQLQQQAAGYQKSINSLNELQGVIQVALSKVGLMLLYSESLQQAFADAILNHYMPGQETFLRDLAAILFMDNFGTNMNNVLMNDTIDFSDASNNYNINNWIQQRSAGNGVYNGTASSALAQQEAEQAQVKTDINKCSKAIADISAQEANLASQVAKGKISPSNAAKIHQELEGDRASLVQAKVYLQNLSTDLGELTFQSVGNNQFKIIGGSVSQVAADEKLVINGDPSQNGLGGLTTIAGDIESKSQYWGGQSQTAQMQLQMTMTQIQQEWAVVTTALQLLNQMYMAVAQAISK